MHTVYHIFGNKSTNSVIGFAYSFPRRCRTFTSAHDAPRGIFRLYARGGEWPARIPFFPCFGPHGAKQGKTMRPKSRRIRSSCLPPADGRKPCHRFRFVPANRSHRALSGINMRVIKQKPRTVFSARFVCSGLPLTQTNENDFLVFQKREPNSLQPAK